MLDMRYVKNKDEFSWDTEMKKKRTRHFSENEERYKNNRKEI